MPGTILYLEDDKALAHITQRALNKAGFTVMHYSEVETFKKSLRTVNFDYVLLDMKIGHATSLELIPAIKAVKDAPIVVLSGYGTIRTAVQAMKLGAINFLSKPCSSKEIVAAFEAKSTEELPEQKDEELKPQSLRAVEWEAIQKALDDNSGNISAAARQLKMHRRTLQRKLSKRNVE